MKKSILCLGLSLLFLACSSDDDSGNGSNEDNVVGKWITISIKEDGEEISNECDLKEVYEIKADNTFSWQDYEEVEDVLENGTIEVTGCEKGDLFTGNFEVKGDEFILKFDDEDDDEISNFKFENGNLILFGEGYSETLKRI